MSNAQPGQVTKRAIDSVVDYTCQNGYEPYNSTYAKCVASSENEGIWELQGSCVGISSLPFLLARNLHVYED